MIQKRTDIRNIAIIAHVDHGKTTLVDGLLKQAQVFRENQKVAERVMDSNDLERERGITILSKNTALTIKDPNSGEQVKVNVVDTPGHADFGGEVERVLNMVDGVLLLVDAAEGPMPQTRFVLRKALEIGHKAIVVINKIDRQDADTDRVLDETFDLFIELGATDEQTDFPVVYTIATHGHAGLTPELEDNLQPLFNTILEHVPCPEVDVDAPLQMLVTTLGYDNYRGLTAVGRVFQGTINANERIARIKTDGTIVSERIRYLHVQEGMARVDAEAVGAGDIVTIAGLEEVFIGETIADAENPIALPVITVEEPTVRMTFGVNTSPLSGREGKWGSSRKLRERLFAEVKHNVSLRVEETESADTFLVSGRGELHLAILIETMRREGFEFQVSSPEVIIKTDPETGKRTEPYEQVFVETSSETVGSVVELLGNRKGEMQNMEDMGNGTIRVEYIVPTRSLLGFRHHFLTATRGMGILNTLFHGYGDYQGVLKSKPKGSLVAFEGGVTNTYGLKNAEPRGILFVGVGVDAYQGMIVGEHQRPGDLDVNVCKKKKLDNMRTSFKEIDNDLTPHLNMSLDECIEYLSGDELLEVTPENLRLRKRVLNGNERAKILKQSKI